MAIHLGETNQKLIDFRKNALEVRIKRDAEAPSRTSTLLSINEAKKHENALADMAYGEKKLRDVYCTLCVWTNKLPCSQTTSP